LLSVVAVDWGWVTTGVSAFVVWVALFIWLGIRTLRRGYWVMFLVGIVLPIFWIIGALISPPRLEGRRSSGVRTVAYRLRVVCYRVCAQLGVPCLR
jgi:hypothetical protein